MKNNTLIIVVCAILFASCSSQFGLMKRRYTKGYHVEVTRQHKQKQHPHKEKQQVAGPTNDKHRSVPVTTPVKTEQAVRMLAKNMTASKETAPVIVNQAETARTITRSDDKRLSAGGNSAQTLSSSIRPLPLNIGYQKNVWGGDFGNRSASKVNEVVLLILCILLPPVAVYLFHGALTTDFWISLILTILFFVPGIVFALLVCFAGVSLN